MPVIEMERALDINHEGAFLSRFLKFKGIFE